VLSGHHNTLGAVFGDLVELEIGDLIQVYSHSYLFIYQITNRMIVPEKYQLLDTRMANLQWILPSQDERLTLITCWPDDSNTHRVIIVAAPVERLEIASDFQ
jgi:sortase A